jgi:hypothetical protein
MLDYGILNDAISDPSITNIKGTGEAIKVLRNDNWELLVDKVTKQAINFKDKEDEMSLFRQWMGNEPFSYTHYLVHGETDDGFGFAILFSDTSTFHVFIIDKTFSTSKEAK